MRSSAGLCVSLILSASCSGQGEPVVASSTSSAARAVILSGALRAPTPDLTVVPPPAVRLLPLTDAEVAAAEEAEAALARAKRDPIPWLRRLDPAVELAILAVALDSGTTSDDGSAFHSRFTVGEVLFGSAPADTIVLTQPAGTRGPRGCVGLQPKIGASYVLLVRSSVVGVTYELAAHPPSGTLGWLVAIDGRFYFDRGPSIDLETLRDHFRSRQ
jgi:hypothetical protein